MEMTTDYLGETLDGKKIAIGTKVTYLGHVVGGNIKVRFHNGETAIMHPSCFKELRLSKPAKKLVAKLRADPTWRG